MISGKHGFLDGLPVIVAGGCAIVSSSHPQSSRLGSPLSLQQRKYPISQYMLAVQEIKNQLLFNHQNLFLFVFYLSIYIQETTKDRKFFCYIDVFFIFQSIFSNNKFFPFIDQADRYDYQVKRSSLHIKLDNRVLYSILTSMGLTMPCPDLPSPLPAFQPIFCSSLLPMLSPPIPDLVGCSYLQNDQLGLSQESIVLHVIKINLKFYVK